MSSLITAKRARRERAHRLGLRRVEDGVDPLEVPELGRTPPMIRRAVLLPGEGHRRREIAVDVRAHPRERELDRRDSPVFSAIHQGAPRGGGRARAREAGLDAIEVEVGEHHVEPLDPRAVLPGVPGGADAGRHHPVEPIEVGEPVVLAEQRRHPIHEREDIRDTLDGSSAEEREELSIGRARRVRCREQLHGRVPRRRAEARGALDHRAVDGGEAHGGGRHRRARRVGGAHQGAWVGRVAGAQRRGVDGLHRPRCRLERCVVLGHGGARDRIEGDLRRTWRGRERACGRGHEEGMVSGGSIRCQAARGRAGARDVARRRCASERAQRSRRSVLAQPRGCASVGAMRTSSKRAEIMEQPWSRRLVALLLALALPGCKLLDEALSGVPESGNLGEDPGAPTSAPSSTGKKRKERPTTSVAPAPSPPPDRGAAPGATSIHLAMGAPVDADPSDDYLIVRPQYALSYNKNRNDPNWVSWNLDEGWMGKTPRRKGRFITDDSLPPGFYRVEDRDYSGSGYDRGHMTRSEDRSRSPEDMAATFILTNVIPQKHELNAGPWLRLEDYSENLAKKENKELFIVAGGIFGKNPPTIGKGVAVPDSCFKIVVILERGQSAKDVSESTRVIAVIMPNVGGILDNPWGPYRVSVDEVEKKSGYRFLTALPEGTKRALSSRVDSGPVSLH
jgi:endonuclease G